MEKARSYEKDLNFEETELRLGLPGCDDSSSLTQKGSKRVFSDTTDDVRSKPSPNCTAQIEREGAPVAKAQVVGWPPVRSSYRKNNLHVTNSMKKTEPEAPGFYVKVSMDGAPYLRKIDLKNYKGYQDLLKALENMFSCFTIGDFAKKEGSKTSEYVPTYEDKDGDWMLVGDVPWEMFIFSCKRLRIMKGSDAIGLGSNASHISSY
ncbi:hypothetical protein AMTRI_Chr03g54440 [Amborella trichopoda]|uniref:Auxin-responsive protein n=1 Tax=Amborella trichopoda TaxID=13333 RepID=W1P0H3_AMBTC|nr:auxin-responsive protein IAA4 [Amborella trichopoda]ERN01438.1 hypothetical protein AMTR_s00002p00266860 [Amborella trichopoda]|eukprot:XP_006838869.1 auxin-responsive protein IAA4 [Amborella trichopoda]